MVCKWFQYWDTFGVTGADLRKGYVFVWQTQSHPLKRGEKRCTPQVTKQRLDHVYILPQLQQGDHRFHTLPYKMCNIKVLK